MIIVITITCNSNFWANSSNKSYSVSTEVNNVISSLIHPIEVGFFRGAGGWGWQSLPKNNFLDLGAL